jgi:hypothetical protein
VDRVQVGPVRGVKIAVAAFALSVVLFAAVVGMAIYIFSGKTTEGTETHDAICALTADLEERTTASKVFLAEHPNGAFGIPASTIRDSVRNQERTIDALSVVSC